MEKEQMKPTQEKSLFLIRYRKSEYIRAKTMYWKSAAFLVASLGWMAWILFIGFLIRKSFGG